MNAVQTHRGPDGHGLYFAPGIGLGHRRLSIIDLDGGQQPLFNEDRTVTVVYNGEIYNYQELASELAALGHRFHSRTDTEVIVHGWEEWGESCVDRFRGMFAFAVWDQPRQTLFLARDRVGIKPLYYSWLPDGRLFFASEMKALLVCPDLARNIDPTAVEDYFAYGYVPDPKSIYRDVFKLPPRHYLCQRQGKPPARSRSYWDIRISAENNRSAETITDELIDGLREAVRVRLISDVPLGAFLSGGVDSSGVVAMMAQTSTSPVNTCAIAFGEHEYDESAYANIVAERYGTRHHVRTVDPNAFDLVDRLAAIYDEPFADSSAMPTYRVCALARERVTVALSGDGGDELFAGYRRYLWHMQEERVRGLLPAWLRRPIFGFLATVYPKADWAPRFLRAKTTFQELAQNSEEAFFQSLSQLNDGLRNRLYSDRFRSELQAYHGIEVLRGHMRAAPTEDSLSKVQYADMKMYLPGDILTKVDRASMANSLEVRVPMLDHRFLGWAFGVPSELKLKNREGKHILKTALEPHVPKEILYRPKMGFSIPLRDWFRGPLRERVRAAVTGPTLDETGWFNKSFLRSLIDQHQSGRRDNSTVLWSLLMFESFLRRVHHGTNVVVGGTPAEVGG